MNYYNGFGQTFKKSYQDVEQINFGGHIHTTSFSLTCPWQALHAKSPFIGYEEREVF
jgi:hypothetical protein